MKNLFKFQRNKKGYWQFGTNWLTDILGGLGTLIGLILLLFWKEIAVFIFLVFLILLWR